MYRRKTCERTQGGLGPKSRARAGPWFNLAWLGKCYRVLKPTGTIWVTGTLHVYLGVGMAMMQQGFRILNDITWEKTSPPPDLGCRCFTHSTETILWAAKAPEGSKHKYTFHYEDMKAENGGKQMKTVWRLPAAGRDERGHGKHPTQKPVALIERCLKASTNPGDMVLDPFAGSGATGVAAIRLGRSFMGCEVEPGYVSLIVKRLIETSSQPLVGLENFHEVAGIVEGFPTETPATALCMAD